jgi:hypothetical protein
MGHSFFDKTFGKMRIDDATTHFLDGMDQRLVCQT